MATYFKENKLRLSVQERQFLFQCRMNDTDAHANRAWKYKDISCISCKDTSKIETGAHLLECKILCDKNDRISYLPTYSSLYSTDIEEQIYTSRMMQQNMYLREAIQEQCLVPM